jgi:motility quorum-sensing regulator / GCU-specific mRNA interferase toxin
MDRRNKPRATHDLAAIQAQMNCVESMNLTWKARLGIHACGMSEDQALEVVQSLTTRHWHKSMPSHYDYRVWQDVYFINWGGMTLYVKFTMHEGYVLISFKESDDT